MHSHRSRVEGGVITCALVKTRCHNYFFASQARRERNEGRNGASKHGNESEDGLTEDQKCSCAADSEAS